MSLWGIVGNAGACERADRRVGHVSKHHQSQIWNAVPHCLMWILWREHNFRNFDDRGITTEDLKLQFFELYLSGCKPRMVSSCASFQDFIVSCSS
jgi:hypothetical protein